MKRLLIVGLLLIAGAAQAIDPYRIVKSTQTVTVGDVVRSTSIFNGPMVAHVVCSATCWVAVHSSAVESVVAAAVSQMVLPDTAFHLAVSTSRYVIFRQGSAATGTALVTGIEDARSR